MTMDLATFKRIIEKWITCQNLEISGVAVLHDGEQETWSASLIVTNGEGSWPQPSVEAIPQARTLCEEGNAPNSEFMLKHLDVIEFIMSPDVKAKRWQAQWTFRGFNY